MIRETLDAFYMGLLNLKTRVSTETEGATMVEYGLMVALIALVAAVGAAALGTGIDNLFTSAETELGTHAN